MQEARLLQKRRQSEKALLATIQQQLPVERAACLRELSQKQEEERITAAERLELLQITDEVEQADVARAEALLALAQQRQLSIAELLRQHLRETPSQAAGGTSNQCGLSGEIKQVECSG